MQYGETRAGEELPHHSGPIVLVWAGRDRCGWLAATLWDETLAEITAEAERRRAAYKSRKKRLQLTSEPEDPHNAGQQFT